MNKQRPRVLIAFAICMALFTSLHRSVYAQDSTLVKGMVVNMSDEPLPNVSIGIEGSMEFPAVSNESGEFSLIIPSGSDWLNIEPSGDYKSKRIRLNGRKKLRIYLTYDDLSSGDDVINILSQNRLKRNFISSFYSLDLADIKQTSAWSLDQYMQGRIPGLYVVNRSGDPNAGAFTMMRGVNSLTATTEPLYIIDGIQVTAHGVFGSNIDGLSYNPLMALNPMDISQVTFIKDPTITAVYGSKASNGLVLINTLDPSATQTVIDLDMRTGFSLTPDITIPQLNANQHKTLISEVLFSSGIYEEQIKLDYPNLFLKPNNERYIDYQHNTFWQDKIFDEAVFSNINLQVKGGDEIARYGLSFGFQNAEGPIKSTNYQGYNLRFVSMLNVFTWLKMRANVSLNYSTAQLKESAKSLETSPIRTALAKSPMLNPFQYDSEGRELTAIAPVDELGVSNPQAVIDLFSGAYTNFSFTPSLGLEATFTDYLSFYSDFGIGYSMMEERVFMPNTGMELYYNTEAINISEASINSLFSFHNNSHLLYRRNFGDHSFAFTTGSRLLTNKFEYDMALTRNSSANDEYRSLQDGIGNLRDIGGVNRRWNWLSVYENVNYSFRDKYLVTASASLDGSSRIGPDAPNTLKINTVPFGLFYGIGVGWRLSEEAFLNSVSSLEELKVRFSYGKTGNDDVGESNANTFYSSKQFRETSGLYPAQIPNPELTYEVVSQINAGVDLSLWGHRMNANIDLYSSAADNMLIYKPIESYYGYDFMPVNGGEVSNKGIDVGIFFRIIDRTNFKWDLSGTWSALQNEVLSMEGDRILTEMEGAEIINEPGSEANSFYGYKFEGVYSTSQEAQEANLLNDKFMPYQAGDAKFSDISGPEGTPDGIINQYDKTVLGSSLPSQFGGIDNTVSYKNWSLSAFVQFVAGNEIFNYVRYLNERMSGLDNQSINVLNRWQYEGHQSDVPRAYWNDPMGNAAFSSRWIEDGSFVRLKNLSLSYTLDREFLAFRNAKFYVSAINLITLSNYLGYDPEFGYSRYQIDQGIDYGLSPQTRQFLAGIKLGL